MSPIILLCPSSGVSSKTFWVGHTQKIIPSFYEKSYLPPSTMSDDSSTSTDGVNTGIDTLALASTSSGSVSHAEQHYASKNHSIKALVAMCRGLLDGDKPLLDISVEPWASMKITTVKPTAKEYKEEIERRWQISVGAAGIKQQKGKPRPKQWLMPKLLEWLDENPISDSADIGYLSRKVAEHKVIAEEAVTMKKISEDLLEKQWTGRWPYLRMIHALVDHDDAKRLFLTRYDLDNGRLQVDNRNSTNKRAVTVWEVVSDWWNDSDFCPITECLPDLHTDFSSELTIDHSLVSSMSEASPEKCENKFSSMMVDLKRVIANWEKSGQGDGGVDVDEDDIGDGRFGSLQNRTRCALDCRHSFVKYQQSYLLYLWHMLDKHNLLISSLQRLDAKVASSNGATGVPSIVMEDAEESSAGSKLTTAENFNRLSESIKSLSSSAMAMARMEAEEKEKDRKEKEKDRVFALQEKEKDRAAQIRVAEIEADNKIRLATIEAKEKQDARTRQRVDALRVGIAELTTQKRQLTIEMLSNKKSKDVADYLSSEIEEIEKEKVKKQAELNDLMAID